MRLVTHALETGRLTVWRSLVAPSLILLLPALAVGQKDQPAAGKANDMNLRFTEETRMEATTGKPRQTTKIVYVKGNRKRIDDDDGHRSTIIQCDLQQYVRLDHVRKTCCQQSFHVTPPTTARAARAERTPRTGGVVLHEADYRDTGERRKLFGLEARHLVSTSVTEAKEGSCFGASRTETETDAWLVDLPRTARPYGCVSAAVVTDQPTPPADRPKPECEDKRTATVKGDARSFHDGFRVSARTSTTHNSRTNTVTTTITDLSFSPLEASLFEAPPNCNCPGERAPAPRGDIKVTETPKELRIELTGDILFDFNDSAIRPEAEDALGQAAELIKKHRRAGVLVEGQTDSKGTDSHNLRLSEQRAGSVKHWLVQVGGIDGANIETKGWGASKPVAPNIKADGSDDSDARQKNRRVEITVRK